MADEAAHDEHDRRTDGPTLLRADVRQPRLSWGRKPVSVRVTSRRLHWGPAESETSIDWTQVTGVQESSGELLVGYVDDAGAPQEVRVLLHGPLAYLVAEEISRRSEAARRNAARASGAEVAPHTVGTRLLSA